MDAIIRKGVEADVPEALRLVKELAEYERALDEVEVSIEEMIRDGFGSFPIYEFFVAESDNEIIGLALFYYKYSTWKGTCIYLDDIVVTEQYRRKGIGKKLFDEVVKVARERKVRKLEWQVLEWNTPAISFYKKIGTTFDDEWINCKLTESSIQSYFYEGI